MQRLEVSGAVRPICGSLGVKRLRCVVKFAPTTALFPEGGGPVPTEEGAVRVRETVWTFRRRNNLLPLPGSNPGTPCS